MLVVRSASKAEMPRVYELMRSVAETGQGYGCDEFPTLNAFRSMTYDLHVIVIEHETSRQVQKCTHNYHTPASNADSFVDLCAIYCSQKLALRVCAFWRLTWISRLIAGDTLRVSERIASESLARALIIFMDLLLIVVVNDCVVVVVLISVVVMVIVLASCDADGGWFVVRA